MFAIGDNDYAGLGKVAEESGEVLQVIGKLMGSAGNPNHWDGTDLLERLLDETADLTAALTFLLDRLEIEGKIDFDDRIRWQQRISNKRKRYARWQSGDQTFDDFTPKPEGVK